MPKIPECVRPWRGEAYRCLLYAHNPHLICCAVHPYGVDSERCPDFQPDPNAEAEELWK